MSEPRRLEVLIIGAGLGGLCAAAFLREHHDVTIVERSLEVIPDDYGISIVANSYGLLLKKGIEEKRFPHAVLTHMRIRDANNASMADMVFDTRKTVGAPSLFAKRSALAVDITRLATDPSLPGTPVTIVRGPKITSIDVAQGTATAVDGTTYSADIIVGADGINSIVRASIETALSTPAQRPRPSGVLAYVCSVPREVIASDPDTEFQADIENAAGLTTYYGTGGRNSRERVMVYPINSTHFQVVGYYPEDAWTDEFDKSATSIIKGVPSSRAVEDFEDFHPSVGKLFSAVSTLDVWRIRDLPPFPTWHSGRAIVIGDAAHAATPHTGHGANMAMEDGEALGYFLSDIPSSSSPDALSADIEKRLTAFESLRVKRSQYVQTAARRAGCVAPAGEPPFDRVAFSRTMHFYSGAENAIKSPETQPSYEL